MGFGEIGLGWLLHRRPHKQGRPGRACEAVAGSFSSDFAIQLSDALARR